MAWNIRERGTETSRLESFSDAVFAFSATLLVVSLEVPETFRELEDSLRGFAAFGLSFTMLILIWTVHNRFFRRYGLQDTATVVLNAVLLFVVLFYVYPLKFLSSVLAGRFFGLGPGGPQMANRDEMVSLLIVYGLGFVAVFAAVALLYRHAYACRDQLNLTEPEVHDTRMWYRHYLIYVGVGVLSVLLAWGRVGVEIGFPGWIYGLLGPLCYAHGTWSTRRRQRAFPE